MPNRGELEYGAAQRNSAPTNAAADNAAWAVVQLCTIGWLISVYFAVLSEPLDNVPALIAQLPFG